MRAFWANVEAPVEQLLDKLVTGKRSFLKMLENSNRFSLLFQEAQKDAGVDSRAFGHILKNFAYAEQRFDSRSVPLFKFFQLLPIAIRALVKLNVASRGDADEEWAADILSKITGPTGYVNLLSSALVADLMLVVHPILRSEDTNQNDVAVTGVAAAQVRDRLHDLFKNRGIWLEQTTGTCVHAVLQSMRGDLVTFSRAGHKTVASLGWPNPTAALGAELFDAAAKYYDLFMAYFDANFPYFDIQNAFVVFDIDAQIDMKDRQVLLNSLVHCVSKCTMPNSQVVLSSQCTSHSSFVF